MNGCAEKWICLRSPALRKIRTKVSARFLRNESRSLRGGRTDIPVCHLLIRKNQTGRNACPTMKPIVVIFGIVVAAFGGVIAYRALFLEPSAAVVITNTEIRE